LPEWYANDPVRLVVERSGGEENRAILPGFRYRVVLLVGRWKLPGWRQGGCPKTCIHLLGLENGDTQFADESLLVEQTARNGN
jgi:hypothetical protein